jgi:SAM-dependent methyltransferase
MKGAFLRLRSGGNVAWWDTYFGELYLRLFETVQTPGHTAQEVAWIIAALDLPPGARILDLGCGQGRHAVPLAQAGYRLAGLDRSTYLLAHAQRAARERGVDVQWVRGDMRRLPWRGQFDACISLFTSFGYFEDEAHNQEVLYQVHGALKPGGTLVLDLSNRDYYLLHAWPRAWRRHGEAIILEETVFDPKTCRFAMTFTWLEHGRAESLAHSVRYYTAPELAAMLRAAGLLPAEFYGDFDGSDLTLDSKRMIVVARKA